jgi:hypothetical protein
MKIAIVRGASRKTSEKPMTPQIAIAAAAQNMAFVVEAIAQQLLS